MFGCAWIPQTFRVSNLGGTNLFHVYQLYFLFLCLWFCVFEMIKILCTRDSDSELHSLSAIISPFLHAYYPVRQASKGMYNSSFGFWSTCSNRCYATHHGWLRGSGRGDRINPQWFPRIPATVYLRDMATIHVIRCVLSHRCCAFTASSCDVIWSHVLWSRTVAVVSARSWNAVAWSIWVADQLRSAHRLQRIDDKHWYIPLLSCPSLKAPRVRRIQCAHMLRKTAISWSYTFSFWSIGSFWLRFAMLRAALNTNKHALVNLKRHNRKYLSTF